jgi:hypothetical protein
MVPMFLTIVAINDVCTCFVFLLIPSITNSFHCWSLWEVSSNDP